MEIDWQTPKELFANLNSEFCFTTDVCALEWNAQCKTFYTPAIDGLAQEWEGVCWCNPPFDASRALWVKKAHEQAQRGCTVVVLLPWNGTGDTEWWHSFALRSSEIRYFRGRISFLNPVGRKVTLRTVLLVFKPYCTGPAVVSSISQDGTPYIAEGCRTAPNTQRAKCPQLAMELEL
jgi:phage N-6-adenine-methyltransferase